MIKDELFAKEPLAYACLANDLRSGHVAQCYLLSGEGSPLLTDAAYLLAMSIVEGRGDFACEECNTCRRIRLDKYLDVQFIDGRKSLIKKEAIEGLMASFTKTALEAAGKKVYILANVHNASAKVLNMLLKQIEEPSNQNTYAIFTTDNVEVLLPTVVSRARKVFFKQRDYGPRVQTYVEQGFEDFDAYLLSRIDKQQEYTDLSNACYPVVRDLLFQSVEALGDKDYLPVLFGLKLNQMVAKKDLKEVTALYLEAMIVLLQVALTEERSGVEAIEKLVAELKKNDPQKLLAIFLRLKECSLSNISRAALFDQLCFALVE